MEQDEQQAPYIPQNKRTAESKLRRGQRNCPVCLTPLLKNAKRSKLKRECGVCRAHPSPLKHCSRCSAQAIWECPKGAACQACGLHGSKSEVVATEGV